MARIKTLTVRGFKSFARKTTLRFPRGLNLILGENGSGKSNLLDSLCFVLGKTSKKELRAEKLDHLIFNGGDGGKPSKYAKVEVVFDNSDGSFPVETKEIKISRTILPDGVSLFRVSGKRTTLNHVRNLLNFAKIDPSGYNVVLQGEVNSFVEMSTLERMETIKDISGIGIYEDKKNKALSELRKVNNKLREAGILLSERERYLRELENQKKQAEKYLGLQNRLKYKNACYYWKLIERQENLEQKAKKEIKKKQEKIKIIDDKILKLNEEISKNKIRIKGIRGIEEKKKEIILAKELESLRTKKISLSESLVRDKEELERLSGRRKGIILGIERNKNEFENLQKKYQKNEKILFDLMKKIQSKELELSAARGFDEKYYKIKEELLNLSSLQGNLIKEKSLKQELNEIIEEKNKKNKVLNKILSSIKETRKIHDRTLKEIEKATDNIIETEREIEGIKTKKKLALESLSRGTREILKLKEKIEGIHGTVGQLAQIPGNFSLPLRIAAGSRMSYVIVDNPKVAQECIKHLREKKLGIATFIPMDKIKGKEITKTEKMFLKMPGVIGFTISFAKFDNKYLNVFKFVFGSTLLVKNIKAARKVGFGSLRMVTIEGDLIETHGAITGGWRRKIIGFNIEELEMKLEKLSKNLPRLNEKQIKLKNTNKNIESHLIELKELQAKNNSEILVLESRIKGLKGELNKIKIKGDLNKIKERINELNKNQRKIESLPTKLSKEEVEKLEEEYKTFTKQRQEFIIQNNTIDRQIKRILNIEIEELKKIGPKVEKEHDKLKNQIEEKEIRLKEVEKTFKEKEKSSKGYTKDLSKLRKELFILEKNNEILGQKIKRHEENKNKVILQTHKLDIRKADVLSKMENYLQRYKEYEGFKIKEVAESVKLLKEQIEKTKERLNKMGPVNLLALERYKKIQEEFGKVDKKVKKLMSEREDILKMIDEVEKKKEETFLETFNQVSANFKKTFSKLSPGGDASLVLEEKENPFEGGIDISAKPQGKPILSIRAMSGGEKAITALSFLFAIQEYEPSPFYVLDEVDASLDKENSERLASLLKSFSRKAQFIVITHNDSVIRRADYLFGVSRLKTGESHIVGIRHAIPKSRA